MGSEGTLPAPGKIRRGWRPGLAGTVIRIGTAIGVLGGVGVATYEAYKHDLLPIHQTINVPAIFDNAKDSGVIGSNNMINVNETTIANIDTVPVTPTLKHDINLLTPFEALSPNVNINYEKSFSGRPTYSKDALDNAKTQNIKDKILFKGVPKDTPIIAPVDGQLEFYVVPRLAIPGTISAINFFYENPDGKISQISIGGNGEGRLKPLIEAKPLTPSTYKEGIDVSTLLVEVKRGQEVAMTLQQTDLLLEVNTAIFSKEGFYVIMGTQSPNNINLISLPNNVGQEKLAILEK